jgi:hypothetical protein
VIHSLMRRFIVPFLFCIGLWAQTPSATVTIRVTQASTPSIAALTPVPNIPPVIEFILTILNPAVGQVYSYTIAGVYVSSAGRTYTGQGSINPAISASTIYVFQGQYGDSVNLTANPPQISVYSQIPASAPVVVN